MIINCPLCKKKFRIANNLIPDEGRNLQCGSCNHVWFYKLEKKTKGLTTLSKNFINKEISKDKEKKENIEKVIKKTNLSDDKIKKEDIKDTPKKKFLPVVKKSYSISNKFFSYLIVSIISFVAMVILLDTVKIPMINIFPNLEIFLFNLYETLQDIKLFIIDLL